MATGPTRGKSAQLAAYIGKKLCLGWGSFPERNFLLFPVRGGPKVSVNARALYLLCITYLFFISLISLFLVLSSPFETGEAR